MSYMPWCLKTIETVSVRLTLLLAPYSNTNSECLTYVMYRCCPIPITIVSEGLR